MSDHSTPNLEHLAIRTIAMPKDTNPSGDIFGGWLVSQMDMAGAMIAKRHSKTRVTTIAIREMTFQKPVKVGDEVSCYAIITKVGRTSITLDVEVWVYRPATLEEYRVTKGEFVFVCIDEAGKPLAF